MHLLQVSKERRKNKPEEWLLQNAKKRAKEKNIPFNISIERHNCSRCVPSIWYPNYYW